MTEGQPTIKIYFTQQELELIQSFSWRTANLYSVWREVGIQLLATLHGKDAA
jgi:hypothetical protein